MAIETRREKIFFYAIIPLGAAILGAFATSVFAGLAQNHDQVVSVSQILKDTSLTSADKLKALEIYKEITDRPWSTVRSLTGMLAVLTGACAFAIADRIKGTK